MQTDRLDTVSHSRIRHHVGDRKKDLEPLRLTSPALGITLKCRRERLERAMGFEPTTTCLGSKDSTTELRPLIVRCHQTILLYTGSSVECPGHGDMPKDISSHVQTK